MNTRRYVVSVLIGLTAGIAGGLFGVGGGLLVVPGLILLLALPPHRAHPTSGAAIAATAGAALAPFAVAGSVDWAAAITLVAGAGVGALIGARIIDRISAVWLTRTFVAVVVLAAIRLFIHDGASGTAVFAQSVDLTVGAFLGLVTAGVLAGLLAAGLGLGGGIVFVPTLAVLYSMDQHVAQGTSLAAMVPTLIVATVAHGRAGRVDWRVAGAVAAGGIVGGLAGAGFALGLDPLLLRRLFTGLLLIVAVRMLLTTRRRPPVPPSG